MSYVFGAPETFLKFKDDVIRITRLIINYLSGTMLTNHITLTIMHIEFSLMFLKPSIEYDKEVILINWG